MSERSRLMAGLMLVAVLGSGIVWLSWRGPRAITFPSASSAAVSEVGGMPAPSSSLAVRPELGPEFEAVTAALSAWARFVSTGHLGVLSGHFAADGPQYRRLVLEAAEIPDLRQGRYEFSVHRAEVARADLSSLTMRTTGTFTGPEVAERLDWLVHLTNVGNRWLLWSVEEAGARR